MHLFSIEKAISPYENYFQRSFQIHQGIPHFWLEKAGKRLIWSRQAGDSCGHQQILRNKNHQPEGHPVRTRDQTNLARNKTSQRDLTPARSLSLGHNHRRKEPVHDFRICRAGQPFLLPEHQEQVLITRGFYILYTDSQGDRKLAPEQRHAPGHQARELTDRPVLEH